MTCSAKGHIPPLGISPQATIVFDKDLFAQIATLADRNKITFASQVRALIKAGLKQAEQYSL